ncbi:MAG: hypothetical protein ACRDTU_03415 [Micromonosporaceae bacterium]
MTSSHAPIPDPRPHVPRHAAPDPALAALLDGADSEIEQWQRSISDIGDQHYAHPGINQVRFESATRAMGPLDQLEAQLRDVLTANGIRERRRSGAVGDRPRRPRRRPIELAGVPDNHLEDDRLRELTYAQLHALAMADHPDEVEQTAEQWYEISRAAWRRGSGLHDLVWSRLETDPQLMALAEAYQGFAARTDHYAKTFTSVAENHRETRSKMEELGPP